MLVAYEVLNFKAFSLTLAQINDDPSNIFVIVYTLLGPVSVILTIIVYYMRLKSNEEVFGRN